MTYEDGQELELLVLIPFDLITDVDNRCCGRWYSGRAAAKTNGRRKPKREPTTRKLPREL